MIFFSIALDESTDLSNTAQLAIFIRGVDDDFNVTEELLELVPMKGTTTGADILEAVEEAISSFGLNWENLTAPTTDGAPAMVGVNTGFVGLLRKKLKKPDLPAIHCFTHQEALCAKSLKMNHVMSVVTRAVTTDIT